jgi:hypothetical protein
MEPDWTKQIPSSMICETYYVFFIIYAVIFFISFVNMAYTMLYVKGVNPALKIALLGINGLFSGLAITLVLFQYLICSRSLLETKK